MLPWAQVSCGARQSPCPATSWGHRQVHQGQESPPLAGRFSGNVRNALIPGQLQRTISGNIPCPPGSDASTVFASPLHMPPGDAARVGRCPAGYKLTAYFPHPQCLASLRAHMGAVGWWLPLPGEGCQVRRFEGEGGEWREPGWSRDLLQEPLRIGVGWVRLEARVQAHSHPLTSGKSPRLTSVL